MSKQPHLNDLRALLMATLKDLRSGNIEVDRARAMGVLADTLVDTARVEVEYLRQVGGDCSDFIDGLKAPNVAEPLPPKVRHIKSGRVDVSQPGRLIHISTDDEEEAA